MLPDHSAYCLGWQSLQAAGSRSIAPLICGPALDPHAPTQSATAVSQAAIAARLITDKATPDGSGGSANGRRRRHLRGARPARGAAAQRLLELGVIQVVLPPGDGQRGHPV